MPSTKLPFQKLHFYILEIRSLAKNSILYFLVMIENGSFNSICLLTQKLQAKSKLRSYIHEIQNKIQRCPPYLNTDHEGEFYSANFRSEAEALVMVFEKGPANSPKTNNISKQLNQTQLTKLSTLFDLKYTIEQVLSLNSVIPFVLKVFLCKQSDSKLLPQSKPFLYLVLEDYSDASQFLDPQTGRVIVSRDYTATTIKFDYYKSGSLKNPIEGLSCIITNNPPSVQSSQVVTIPTCPRRNPIAPLAPTIPGDMSPPAPGPSSEPIAATESKHVYPSHEPCPTLGSPSCISLPQKKGYTYLPQYCNSPKDINSSISRDNIMTKLI
ncbi:hypothetical protein O181_022809 [Austropuccinia psidii MF-1]|uniref:Integrase catalytic domain-containing protein n=1 Tax=Austropuccinia psidii MF-1 TaxID=1389203 RepID=A0A9Q3CFI2_9BASI|nr:hypothetical protein [Austropuccinia psidii MF-1]